MFAWFFFNVLMFLKKINKKKHSDALDEDVAYFINFTE